MFLNLGGGNFHQSGWLNVDYPFEKRAYKQKRENIDIVHNFMEMKPLPFEDNSIEIVYTEHCIEHLLYAAVKYLFADVYRILVPGGVLRISCPDADILYNMYKSSKIKNLGFSHKLAGSSKEVELVDALCTPVSNLIDQVQVKKIFNDCPVKEDFFSKIESYLPEIKAGDQIPGHHLSWWNFTRLNSVLNDLNYRKVKLRGQRESKLKQLRDRHIDKTASIFSVRVECAK